MSYQKSKFFKGLSLSIAVVPLLFIAVTFCFTPNAFSNAAAITNFGPAGIDTTARTMTFKFTPAWNNSWRTGTNNDALWVFMKYYHPHDSVWRHATMRTVGINPSGFGAPSGLVDVIVPEDKKGFFLQRSQSNAGGGTVDLSALSGDNQYVTFIWDYGHDFDALVAAGESAFDIGSNNFDFKIFAVEMVYVPQGSFLAMGPGTITTANSPSAVGFNFLYNDQAGTKTYTQWWPINNEDAMAVYGNALDQPKGYYDISSGPYTIPAQFPKGYQPFYMMKYEISQGQYRDFLNNLTSAQAENRCSASASAMYCASATNQSTVSTRAGVYRTSSGYGCDLDDDGTPDESNDGEWVAMSNLDWMDLTAFLDWSALRPMSELEFEKAARGPDQTSGNLFVWGATSLEAATTALADAGTSSELPSRGNMNYTDCSPDGPFRVGSYADGSSTRTAAGAGYYGNMNLGGNVNEMAIDLTIVADRNFAGSHGDGVLTSSGYGNNPDWPGYSSGAVTTGSNFFRGTSYGFSSTSGYVYFHPEDIALPANRNAVSGGRGVRTSPTIIMAQ